MKQLLLQRLLKIWKNKRQMAFLVPPSTIKNQYAIAGTGRHAIANLYPCIWYSGAPVRMIYSGQKKKAELAAVRWAGCVGEDNLDAVAKAPHIQAVFVATPPAFQLTVTVALLRAGKHVFVEKPVGYSLAELQTAIAAEPEHTICQVGLQRRFAPVGKKIKRLAKHAAFYSYRFCIGPHEGNCLYDVFLHPVDYLLHLFGPAEIKYVRKTAGGGSETYFVHLLHEKVDGWVELSSAYSWQTAFEELTINTKDATIHSRYPNDLSVTEKPAAVWGVSVDRFLKTPVQTATHLSSAFLPTQENNSLYLAGFFPEIEHFVRCVENGRKPPYASLKSLLPAYEILEKLKKA